MIVLDTTVLVYALGAEHRFRDPCRRLLSAIADREIEATASVEVIQEFVHVRARRRGVPDAAATARDYLELLSPLLVVSGVDLQRGLALYEQIEPLGAFDAVLAAAALANGVSTLVSADAAFSAVAEIEHIVPDNEGVDELLAQRG